MLLTAFRYFWPVGSRKPHQRGWVPKQVQETIRAGTRILQIVGIWEGVILNIPTFKAKNNIL